jgi:hypothetical protein
VNVFGDLVGSICDFLLTFLPEGGLLATLVAAACSVLSDLFDIIGSVVA